MFKIGIASKKMSEENECKPAYVQLPATEKEIDKAFQTAEIADNSDCNIVTINKGVTFLDEKLTYMEFGDNAFHELNYLAHQLAGLSSADMDIFNGMITIENPKSLKDLINLSANLDFIHYIPEVKTAEQLGKFLVDNNFVEVPEKYLKYLDYAKIGREHLDDFSSAITQAGYIEDGRNPEAIKTIYDGITLPEINLPEKPRLEILSDCLESQLSADEIMSISDMIVPLDDAVFEKFCAVAEYWTAEDVDYPDRDYKLNADSAGEILNYLDDYNHLPGITSYDGYGRYCLEKANVVVDRTLEDCINLYHYGTSKMLDNDDMMTKYGAVECTNDSHKQEMKQLFSEAPNMDMQMGGM